MGRRRGRRDNGLDAADYAAVGDLDPRVGEHLLDLLGEHGIAAYLQPSVDVNPITRNSTVPHRPVDRLYADRAHLRAARDLLRQFTTDGSGGDAGPGRPAETGAAAGTATPAQFDATFAGIVAGYDRPVDPTSVTWPAAENLTASDDQLAGADSTWHDDLVGPDPAPAPDTSSPVDARHITEPWILGEPDVGRFEPAEGPGSAEPGERFVPPPPPPLPRLSRQAVLGGLAVLAGLILVLAPGAGPFGRTESILLGFAGIFGGAVALILRLRPGTDPDDHPDDGARV